MTDTILKALGYIKDFINREYRTDGEPEHEPDSSDMHRIPILYSTWELDDEGNIECDVQVYVDLIENRFVYEANRFDNGFTWTAQDVQESDETLLTELAWLDFNELYSAALDFLRGSYDEAVYDWSLDHPTPEEKQKRLCEAVYDITDSANYLAYTGQIELPEDSRALFDTIYYLAVKFEEGYYFGSETVGWSDDYIADVDLYADTKLKELYGKEAD
jgi:hypothetical protein